MLIWLLITYVVVSLLSGMAVGKFISLGRGREDKDISSLLNGERDVHIFYQESLFELSGKSAVAD
jgi:hypothetical protein